MIILKDMPDKVIIQRHAIPHKCFYFLLQFFYWKKEPFYPYQTKQIIKCYEHQ